MLSYQHSYHAGCFADVVKHLTLTRILNYMGEKEKPIFYLETHSGRGMYDLKNTHAMKTSEFLQGITPVWEQRKKLSPLFSPYFDVIKSLNHDSTIRHYPGSPYFALSKLRSQDRLICAERHPKEFSFLEKLPTLEKNVSFRHADGFQELHALLPPPERRGLIFIDPSYEVKEEYKQIPKLIKSAYQRFATGVYCLWYPIVDKRLHQQLVRGLHTIPSPSHLQVEFSLNAPSFTGMSGCGLWIINPPYTLASEMKTILDGLRGILNPGISSYLIES